MSVRLLVRSAMVLAIIIVLGFIPAIPLGFIPVPIALQNLGILLAGILLPKKNAFLVVLIFLVLVAAGMPLLSGGRGGFAVFVGPTVGYLVAYPFAAFLISYANEKIKHNNYLLSVALFVIGVLFIDLAGAVGMTFTTNVSLLPAIAGNIVFVPGDVLKVIVTIFVYVKLPERLKNTGVVPND